jgi:hypothetical protein
MSDKRKTELLKAVMQSLAGHMEATRALGLTMATELLAAAKLELAMHIHDVSDSKLQRICEMLEAQGHLPAGTATGPMFPETAGARTRRQLHSRDNNVSVMRPGARRPRRAGRSE